MPRVQDLVELKVLAVLAKHLGFVTDGAEGIFSSLTATGNNSQASAYQIIGNVNQFTTVTSTNNSVKLPTALSSANGQIVIKNSNSADSINLFPAVGDSLNDLAANTAIQILPGQSVNAFRINDTKWIVSSDGGLGGGTPVGAGLEWYSDIIPAGFLLQDGTAISRTTYASLFSILGTTFGVGDGSTTFNLPDKRQRFSLGKAVSGTGSTLGGTGGAIDHTHAGPSHTHTVPAHSHDTRASGATINITSSGSHNHQSSTGADFAIFVGGTGPVGSAAGNNLNGANTTNSTSHTHANSSFDGKVGNVTSGIDGDASMTSGASGTGNTGTANPPFIAVNYIIKY
jgi:microcystin-dependent protein